MLRWTPAFLLLLSMNLSAQCPCMDLQNDEDDSVNFMTSLDQSLGFEADPPQQTYFFAALPEAPPEQQIQTNFQYQTITSNQTPIQQIEEDLTYESSSSGNGVKTVIVNSPELFRQRKKAARKGMKSRKKVKGRRGGCPVF